MGTHLIVICGLPLVHWISESHFYACQHDLGYLWKWQISREKCWMCLQNVFTKGCLWNKCKSCEGLRWMMILIIEELHSVGPFLFCNVVEFISFNIFSVFHCDFLNFTQVKRYCVGVIKWQSSKLEQKSECAYIYNDSHYDASFTG